MKKLILIMLSIALIGGCAVLDSATKTFQGWVCPNITPPSSSTPRDSIYGSKSISDLEAQAKDILGKAQTETKIAIERIKKAQADAKTKKEKAELQQQLNALQKQMQEQADKLQGK